MYVNVFYLLQQNGITFRITSVFPSSGSDFFTIQPYDGRIFLTDSLINDVNRPNQYQVLIW